MNEQGYDDNRMINYSINVYTPDRLYSKLQAEWRDPDLDTQQML
ncbi:MAG: hypothetical protein J07HQW2_02643 [Haloquadratum walsbyi J07HQW2]|uniref:Uncharacterized protein n=1 Tax=Haloquadratum walsbyi J07HQW2 TaxID=1238425 RepID=U1NH24_9EURY|nr:MAG: hypothetical protein J07HQW2_02643 [Haloquadratum walsbyi J07HQW2]